MTIVTTGCLEAGGDVTDVGVNRQPLINGQVVVNGDDPAVVALLGFNDNVYCTGTLISPSIVATAAHCIDDAANDPELTAFFGDDAYGFGRKVPVTAAQANLGWQLDSRPANDKLGRYDIGLVRLESPQDPSLPVRLYHKPVNVGDEVRRLGFGGYVPSGTVDGKKRSGLTNIVRRCDLDNCNQFGADSDTFETAGTEVSTCGGDSGGPAFITDTDGAEYLASVHSYGLRDSNNNCVAGGDGSTRVDVYADSWVLPFVQENDPACGLDGLCGYIGCTDDPDCTPCGLNGECVQDCALPDPDCATQAVGEICQANPQCLSGRCIPYAGDPEYRFCTEPCDPASDSCPSGMACQNIDGHNLCGFAEDPPGVLGDSCGTDTDCGSYVCEQSTCVYDCDGAAGTGCPTGFECTTIDGGQNYYCHASDSGGGGGGEGGGGCAASGGTETPVLLLLGLFLLLVRRTRREKRRYSGHSG